MRRGTLKSASRSGGELANLALACRRPLLQHNGSRDFFAQLVVRHGESDRLVHGWMGHEHFIDFERRDLLAATIDDLLEPAGDLRKPSSSITP